MEEQLPFQFKFKEAGVDMSEMKKLDARQELLVITMEECGELIHACSKALRRGELYENSDSQLNLKQEVGDVYTMIDLLVEWDVLSWTEIEEQRNIKREKLKKWSDLI
jgi:NTP pyrophosphatase (non-canonical NTP hydrolase)